MPTWGVFGAQNRPKMGQVGLKMALETIMFEKSECSRKVFKNKYKINNNDPKSGHKTAQDRPQTVPGRSCRGVFFGSFFAVIFA